MTVSVLGLKHTHLLLPQAGQGTYTDGIDVRFMPCECLTAGSLPYVPQLGSGIAGPGDKEFEVWGDSQAHAVSSMTHKHSLLLSCFNIPERAVRGGEKSRVLRATATEVLESCGHGRWTSLKATLGSLPHFRRRDGNYGPGYLMEKDAFTNQVSLTQLEPPYHIVSIQLITYTTGLLGCVVA